MSKWPNWVIAAIISLVIVLLPLIWANAIYSGNNKFEFIFSVLIVVILAAFASVVLGKIITNDIDIKYLISEDNGNASLSRFQFLLFTFVIAASYFLFVAAIVTKDVGTFIKDGKILLPDIPGNVLGLIGISGGSYVVAKAIQKSTDAGSSVVRVQVTSAGAGYATPPTITFIGGGGTGAQATTALDAAGGVSRIDVTTPGSGYTAAPTVQIAGGGGAGATAVAVIG
jgi:hypothetical protein